MGVIGGGGDSLIGILHRVAASMFDAMNLAVEFSMLNIIKV